MGGPRGCYVKWNNPDRERQMLYDITQMWNLKNNISKQNRNILIDAEHSDSCQMGEGLRGWVTKVIKDNISQWRPHCGHMAYIGLWELISAQFQNKRFSPCTILSTLQMGAKLRKAQGLPSPSEGECWHTPLECLRRCLQPSTTSMFLFSLPLSHYMSTSSLHKTYFLSHFAFLIF